MLIDRSLSVTVMHVRKCMRRGFGLFAVVLLALATTQTAFSKAIDDQERAVLVRLAEEMATPDRTDELLAQLHFPPQGMVEGPTKDYNRAWPTLRKLEAAYSSAVAAGGEPGGAEFLRAFSRLVAVEQTNAIRYDPALRRYFPEPIDMPVDFKAPDLRYDLQRTTNPSRAGPQLRSILLTLSRYTGGLPGGLQSLMANCCKLDQEKIFEILRTSLTSEHALEEALVRSGVPPELKEKIRRMLSYASELTHALRYEEIFRPFIDPHEANFRSSASWQTQPGAFHDQHANDAIIKMQEQLDNGIETLATKAATENEITLSRDGWFSGGSANPGAAVDTFGGIGGGSGGRSPSAWNAERHRTIANSVTQEAGGSRATRIPPPLPPGRAYFRTLARGGGGYGGVVMGNDISAPKLPKLKQIMWVRNGRSEPAAGHFEFLFENGTTGYSNTFPEQMAAVARTLVYEGVGKTFPPVDSAGQGVGLAGVDKTIVPIYLPRIEDGRVANTVARPFVVHPALDGTPVGYAAVAIDALTFIADEEWFSQRLRESGASEQVVEKAMKWRQAKKGFYKITDVPMQISRQADNLVRVFRPPIAKFGLEHRQAALLTTQTFTKKVNKSGDGPLFVEVVDPEFRTPFYDIVPSLTRSFDDFRQLNQFAAVFALVRHSRLNGAEWSGDIPTPKRGPSATWVRLLKDGSIQLLSTRDVSAALLAFVDGVEAHSRKLASQSAAPDALSRTLVELSGHRLRALEAAMSARELFALAALENVDKDKQRKAIMTLGAKADEATKAQSEISKAMLDSDLGVAPKADFERLQQARKELDAARQTLGRLQDEYLKLTTIDGRLKAATDEVRDKVGELTKRGIELRKKLVEPGLSDKQEAAASKELVKLSGDIDELLPVSAERIEEIRRSIDTTMDSSKSNSTLADDLLNGPLAQWKSLVILQTDASKAWNMAVSSFLPSEDVSLGELLSALRRRDGLGRR